MLLVRQVDGFLAHVGFSRVRVFGRGLLLGTGSRVRAWQSQLAGTLLMERTCGVIAATWRSVKRSLGTMFCSSAVEAGTARSADHLGRHEEPDGPQSGPYTAPLSAKDVAHTPCDLGMVSPDCL